MTESKSSQRALADALLQDAQVTELSDATRLACAFEAGFQYLAGIVASKLQPSELTAPNELTMRRAFESLGCTADDEMLGRQLLEWYGRRWDLPVMPCSVSDAVAWAERIQQASVR